MIPRVPGLDETHVAKDNYAKSSTCNCKCVFLNLFGFHLCIFTSPESEVQINPIIHSNPPGFENIREVSRCHRACSAEKSALEFQKEIDKGAI